MSQNSRQPYKTLFLLSALVALITTALFIWSLSSSSKLKSEVNLNEIEIDSLQKLDSFYKQIIQSDGLIIMDGDYKGGLESYAQLLSSASEEQISFINARIKEIEKITKMQVEGEGGGMNTFDLIIERNNQTISSLELSIDSIKRVYSNKIDSLRSKTQQLTAELSSKPKELPTKSNLKVISFKNDNGNLIHYLGEVSNEKANGGGIGIWTSGSIYKGAWKNNKRHGKGTFEWADGVKYVGDYFEDKREGEGIYYWTNGERYDGEWKSDKRNGYGIWYDSDGNIKFEGGWENDKPKK